MEECGGGAECGFFTAIEEFAQIAGKEAALSPLHAVAEDDFTEGQEDDPARWFFGSEDVFT